MALARKPYVVIDAEILSSSIWDEAPATKLVWLTLLILCDTDGYVGAAVPGIARAAGVSREDARKALEVLMAPDPESRTQTHEGRRVKQVERGFQVLNFATHLERLSAERAKARDRVRKHRARKRAQADSNVTVRPGSREKGVGSRDTTEVGREVDEPPAPLPTYGLPAEQATASTVTGLQLRLASLLGQLEAHPRNPGISVVDWCRRVTAYKRRDGSDAKGVADYRTLQSIDRLEKSVGDAEWWLGEVAAGRVTP